MKYLSMGTDSGIGSAGASDTEGHSGKFADRFFDAPLNGLFLSLSLPAMKTPAVVRGDESHSCKGRLFMAGIN